MDIYRGTDIYLINVDPIQSKYENISWDLFSYKTGTFERDDYRRGIIKETLLEDYFNRNICNIIRDYLCSWIMIDHIICQFDILYNHREFYNESVITLVSNCLDQIAVSSNITNVVIECKGYDKVRKKKIQIEKMVKYTFEDRKDFTIRILAGYMYEMVSGLDLIYNDCYPKVEIKDDIVYIIVHEGN